MRFLILFLVAQSLFSADLSMTPLNSFGSESVQQVLIHKRHLYALTDTEHINIFDILDLENPVRVNTVRVPVFHENEQLNISEMIIHGDTLYLPIKSSSRLLQYDIRNPKTPVLQRHRVRSHNFRKLRVDNNFPQLSVDNNMIGMAGSRNASLWDISEGFCHFATLSTNHYAPPNFRVDDGLLLFKEFVYELDKVSDLEGFPSPISESTLAMYDSLLIEYDTNNDQRLVDYSIRTSPVTRYNFRDSYDQYRMYQGGILARREQGLAVFDFVDQDIPELKFHIENPDIRDYTYGDGVVAIVESNGSFSLYDLEQDGLGRHYNRIGSAGGLWTESDLLYVAHGEALRIFDISQPGEANQIGAVTTEVDIRDVTVRNDLAFAATSYGMAVIDVTNPRRPEVTSRLFLNDELPPGGLGAKTIMLGDDLAFLRSGVILLIVDISDPQNPVFRSKIDRFDQAPTQGMSWNAPVLEFGVQRILPVSATLMPARGLAAYDLSNPDQPKPVTARAQMGHSGDWLTIGDLFYGVYTDGREVALDVVDLSHSGPLPQTRTKFKAQNRWIHRPQAGLLRYGDFLLMNADESGIHSLDISDPYHPKSLDLQGVPTAVGHMRVYGDRLFATDKHSGAVLEFQLNTRSLQQIAPWVVNNSGFTTQTAVHNDADHPADVLLRAVDQHGRTVEKEINVPAGGVFTADAATLFGDLTGYSLYVYADTDQVYASFLIFNREAASGGNSPSQTTALTISQLTSRAVFGHVPGDQTAAIVLTAPAAKTTTPVTMTLYDSTKGVLAETQLTLIANQPTAVLVSALFPELELPVDAALIAQTHGNEPVAGITFIFNELRQPSMAAAMPIGLRRLTRTDISGDTDYLSLPKPIKGYLYAAANGVGLDIFDVQSEPRFETRFIIENEKVKNVTPLSRDRLGILTDRSFLLADISNPTQPEIIESMPVSGGHSLGAFGDHVYLTLNREMWVLDAGGDQLQLLNRIDIGRLLIRGSIVISNQRLHLFGSKLTTFDLSNPAQPELASSNSYQGYTADIAVSENLTAIAGISGLMVFDFSDLSNPQLIYVDTVDTDWLAMDGQTLWQGHLRKATPYYFDQDDWPVIGSTTETEWIRSGMAADGVLYMAGRSSGLFYIDPANDSPAAPVPTLTRAAPDSAHTTRHNESHKGDRCDTFYTNMQFYGTGWRNAQWCQGDLVVVVREDLSLFKINSDEESFCLLSSIPFEDDIRNIAFEGSRIYASSEESLSTIDITDLTKPTVIATAPLPDSAVVLGMDNNDLVLRDSGGAFYRYRNGHAQHLIPWVVSNAAFSSRIALFNGSGDTARVRLEATDRTGRTEQKVLTIQAGGAASELAGDLFPGMNGYSLRVTSNMGELYVSFLTINLDEISGGNSPSQTTAAPIETLTDQLLFGYVPGDEIAAVVLSAAETQANPNRQIPVRLTLHDKSGPVAETEVTLIGNQPLAGLVNTLFTEVPTNASIRATALDGTAIGGVTFVFNQRRQPSMARAITPN